MNWKTLKLLIKIYLPIILVFIDIKPSDVRSTNKANTALARLGIKLQNHESCHLIGTLNWFIQYRGVSERWGKGGNCPPPSTFWQNRMSHAALILVLLLAPPLLVSHLRPCNISICLGMKKFPYLKNGPFGNCIFTDRYTWQKFRLRILCLLNSCVVYLQDTRFVNESFAMFNSRWILLNLPKQLPKDCMFTSKQERLLLRVPTGLTGVKPFLKEHFYLHAPSIARDMSSF